MVNYTEQELLSYLRESIEIIMDEIPFKLEKKDNLYVLHIDSWVLNRYDYLSIEELFKSIATNVNISVEPNHVTGWDYRIEVE